MKVILKSMISWFKRKINAQNQLNAQISKRSGVLIEGSEIYGRLGVESHSKIHHCLLNGDITIGRYTSLWGPNIHLNGKIDIGSFCSIAHNTSIISYSHNLKRPSTYYFSKNLFKEEDPEEILDSGMVEIGSDVWIGSNVQILPNVRIGHGAVVGAGSVVTKNIEPYTIVGGNPARPIRKRFEEDVIAELLRLEWWNWEESKIRRNKVFFQNDLSLDTLNKISGEDY